MAMVRLPICQDCAAGRDLCPLHKEMLEKGLLSETDIKVSRILYELDRYYRIGDTVELVRAIDIGSFVLLLVRGDVSRLIGKSGRVLKAIRQKVGKPVRIVEIDVDLKKSIQDLFSGARVIGVGEEKKEGKSIYKIYVLRRDVKFLPFKYKDLEKALSYIVPGEFVVEFV